jgi:predicted dehydrogenase
MIGIAIIGAGSIADTHIKACLTFSGRCEVRALCDLYPEKAEGLKAKHGLKAVVSKDFRAALDRNDIDLVSICLPPSAHAEAAVAALEAGKHVLVEKPMASSLEECDAMIDAAAASGKLLSVVAQNRYKVPVMKVKRVLESGIAGRVVYTMVNSFWWRGRSYYDLWWRGTWDKEGGGCTLNHAVHHIDLLRWMLGMPLEVTAVITNADHPGSEVEDLSISVLKYPEGALAQLTASLVSHGEEQELIFQAEKARISVPWRVKASLPLENGFPVDNPGTEKELRDFYDSLPAIPYEGHDGQLDNVLAAIEGKQKLLIDGTEGRRTLELIMGIYKSAVTRGPVPFPLAAGDPFCRRETMTARMPRFHKKTKAVDNFSESGISLGRNLGT